MANFTSIQISKSSFINWYTSSGKFFERSLADQSEAFLLANQSSKNQTKNNLLELWALLHFLMPDLFDSRKGFSEWFHRPIGDIVEGTQEYNKAGF